MSVLLDVNTPGLEDASARLAELEASDSAAAAAAPEQEQREPAAPPAAAAPKDETQNPASKQTDTPAATDKAPGDKPAAETEAGKKSDEPPKPGEAKPGEGDTKSKFAKSQERLEKTWENVKKRKGEIEAKEQQLTQREQQLREREESFKRQAEESQAQHKPEEVENAAKAKYDRAKALNERAEGLEAKAKKLEDDGKYTEAADAMRDAKALRKQANKEEGNADDLKAYAEQLRKNPPPSMVEREAKTEAQRKEWTMKAAQDFPELGKKDSELQKSVAAHLNALWQQDRALASHPQIIYHVTRLAAAETAAARVPGLEKQLGEYKAKVQELEKLTAPAAPGSAQRPGEVKTTKTDEEERAELGELAAAVGDIR